MSRPTAGNGLPTRNRLRRYQKLPETRSTAAQIPPIRSRAARGAASTTPTVSAATGAMAVTFAPSASPAASAARPTAPSRQRALTSSAAEASTRAPATMSLPAVPAWEVTSAGAASSGLTAITLAGATP